MDNSISSNIYGWFTSIIRRVKTKLPESNNAAGTTVQNDLLINASFTEPPNQNEKSSHSFPADPECNTATYLFTINSSDIIKTVKMDNEPKSVSSIEEDIEEAITEVSSDADQPDSKSKSNEAVMKKRQLFDLDPGDVSADFLIDDKALSGGGLTQHFHLDKSESLKETGRSRKDEVSERTENDVPEIDESSQLYTRSLDFKSSILNVDPHECLSLDSQLRVIQPRPSHEDLNQSFERDQLVEEVMESNHSVEMTLNDDELSSLGPHIDINDESQMNKILGDSHDSLPSEKNLPSENLTRSPRKSESEKLLASDNSSRSGKSSSKAENSKSAKKSDPDADELVDKVIVVKRMEQVKGDFFKEALDDITEESERQSQQCVDAGNDNTSNDFDSIISLNMIQMLENKVKDLQEIVASKDVCLESLNMQLHSAHARDSFTTSTENRDSLRDLPPSGRDSSSLATTTSTEYRTLLDDFAPKVFNFPDELIQRDQLIEKLTESLQQSVKVREELQTQSEALSGEVQQLRKQLAETLEQFKKPYWPRDQESSTTGQRLSEIEIDLVSESDEDLGEHFLTDNEEKMSTSNRNSRERQLGDMIGVNITSFENFEPGPIPASKQIEQFQKYLNSDEMRIYFMVQKKFDDYLSEEIEKVKMKYEAEIKMLTEQLEIEKCDKDFEGAPSEEMRRSTSPKQIDDELLAKSPVDHDGHNLTLVGDDDDISPCLIIEQDDVGINESQEIRDIAADYHRRLQEQVTLAKQDIVQELENHIQALLSGTTPDDNHWPPDLILLREKFTAKSQLEIVHLQMKHEEEMSRLKDEHKKQLKRKNERNSTFDLARDLDQIVCERDNLRELSTTLRYLLQELAKCVSFCENDLNSTIVEELQKYGVFMNQGDHNVSGGGDNEQCSGLLNISTQSNQELQSKISKSLRLVPDVSALLSLIEDPTLIGFIANNNSDAEFELKECLDKLRAEANGLLVLSEKLNKHREKADETKEKRDSCEEEDGLKAAPNRPSKINRANSFNEGILREPNSEIVVPNLSLPVDINRLEICTEQAGQEEIYSSNISPNNEPISIHELQNRLVKSERDRLYLIEELQLTITKNKELGTELNELREQLKQLDSSQREDLSEGYGIGDIQSPPRLRQEKKSKTSFAQLQDKARNILSTPTKNMSDNTSFLLHLIEEFCREGDKMVEGSKRDRDDLQAQIDAADKKLKDTRQFLDIQASDREAERDEFVKEIEKLKLQIREKEKERISFEMASKEFEQMEQQIRDLTQQVSEYEAQKDKLEMELKASIDKIFVLREIITDLETQVDTKALNENVLNEKVKELETFITTQARSNETLHQEVESLKSEIGHGYQERIAQLEEQLRNTRTSSEQNIAIEQFTEQLRDIETTLDQKTKTLESLHAANSNSLSDNFSEDISVQNLPKETNPTPQASPINTPRHHSLPIDEVQRVFQKLSKHTRVEEAAIKRIKDLEMQVASIRTGYAELENERKLLQEKMTEQVVRISTLQSKLEEQRLRAEELNRQGTSGFAARIHDLQSEVYNLKETLSARDKQIANLKNQLEESVAIINRQEAELAVTIQGGSGRVTQLEAELKVKAEEIKQLKEKMKKEMINKLALPDLMETMLADKNEEIDHLKEQLDKKEKELQGILNINLEQNENSSKEKEKSIEQGDGSKGSGRTLSDIVSISEFDEPDVIRRAMTHLDTPLELPQSSFPEKTMESSKRVSANLTEKPSGDMTMFDLPATSNAMRTFDHPNFFMATSTSSKMGNNTTPSFVPRQINFSEFADDTKMKESTPQIIEVTGAEGEEVESLRKLLKSTEDKAESLKMSLEAIESEKSAEIGRLKVELETKAKMYEELVKEKNELEQKLVGYAQLEVELKAKSALIEELKQQIDEHKSKVSSLEKLVEEKTSEIAELKTTLARKTDNATDSNEKILDLNQQIELLNKQMKQKDEILSKCEKNILNYQQNEKIHSDRVAEIEDAKGAIQAELDLVRAELSEKVLLYQKAVLDLESYSSQFERLEQDLAVKEKRLKDIEAGVGSADEINELRQKIQELDQRNAALESELERLRSQSGDSKPYSLDEIAEKVEKELNYSAQLDSNILKAIESEEENNLNVHTKSNGSQAADNNLTSQLEALKAQLEKEHQKSTLLQQQLNEVRAQTQDIQKQDADIIEAMRLRLEEAIDKETELHKILDEEREKCERLTNQLTVLQRTEARKSSLLKTPPDSPRKAARAAEDAEAIERLKEELKLINSQNERERERVNDLQKVLEREKNRFEKELIDRAEYSEKLKKEMDKLKHDKDLADEEVEHLQERLTSATREIESLEARISTLQEAETRRAYRRGKERAETTQNAIEMQEIRNKIVQLESERDHLNEVIKLLREDVERGAQREAKLAGALANAGNDNSIPEQFMQKLKEMNYLLSENAKENRQMAETLQYLTDERKMLQRKCEELESTCQTGALAATTLSEMEERANHLFGKYLRVESHRKALVHQKRYLMIVLQTYQENEAKALSMLNGGEPRRKKRRSFKSVALIVIAIERMKFIVRRWHTGKIVVSKSIFNMATQKRLTSASASGNASNSTRAGKHILTSLSPPCRDQPQLNRQTFASLAIRPPLQAPSLISEYTDKSDWTNRWRQT